MPRGKIANWTPAGKDTWKHEPTGNKLKIKQGRTLKVEAPI